ncbi:hypothetical protein [Halosolutus gelatinilyticus]|uniref:hypothetical protein n=1 Tax=Halosolutus gelatinilyticus TaxID=2931975 RepID=UPI001FF179FA|nr:hypothetical protein [Halosolutus gelatinilyticus]
MREGDHRSTSIYGGSRGGLIREVYEEYDVGSTRVGMIVDPKNEHAWIQSDVTIEVRP